MQFNNPCISASAAFMLLFSVAGSVSAHERLSKKEIRNLLVGKTEIGRVVKPSANDIGRAGTRYRIIYKSNGTFTYVAGRRTGVGRYSFQGNSFCRAPDGGGTHCRNIFKISGQSYEGVGFRTGKTRYRFKVQ